MKAKELKHFETLLMAMRKELLDQGDANVEPNRVDASTNLDEDAKALNEMNQIIASRTNKKRAGSLGQINAALQRLRLDPEDFGLCLECEEPIAQKRLELLPYAEFCVNCQGKRDAPRVGGRRKLTDYKG